MHRLLFTALACLMLFSCSKYDEGPFLSLRSKKKRLSGEWNVVNPPSSCAFFDIEDPSYLDDLSEITFQEITWKFNEIGDFEVQASWNQTNMKTLTDFIEIVDTTYFSIANDPLVGNYSTTFGTLINAEAIDTSFFSSNYENLIGNWTFENDKEYLSLSLNSNTDLSNVEYLISALMPIGDFRITRLTNCELWIEKDGHELRLEKLD